MNDYRKCGFALGIVTFSMLALSQVQVQAASNELVDSSQPDTALLEIDSTTDDLTHRMVEEEAEVVNRQKETTVNDYEFDAESASITGYHGEDTAISIPSEIEGTSVEHVGRQAFSGKKLDQVDLPDGLKSIDTGGFIGNNLVGVSLPPTTEKIGDMAFAANTQLESIELNEGLQTIGDRAFFNAQSLKAIQLPDSLVQIGNQAFRRSGLSGELVIGSKMEHVGHGILNDVPNQVDIKIVDGPGSKLYLHDDVFQETDTYLRVPQNREVMVFGRAFKGSSPVILDAGQLVVESLDDLDAIRNQLDDKILLTSGYANIDTSDASGASDTYIETPLVWDLSPESLVYNPDNNSYRASGYFTPISSTLYATHGVNEQATEENMARMTVLVDLVLDQDGTDTVWASEDFEYGQMSYKAPYATEESIFVISSFSALGLEKAANNPNLVVPTSVSLEENGQTYTQEIRGISERAFNDVALQSLVIPETSYPFVVGASAFEGSGLESVSFNEGLAYIGARAFANNNLQEVSFPSTLWMTGNQSFVNNSISSLSIHPKVNRLQIDNFSFANNQLTEVDLPYDLFKIRDYVFKGNPGYKPLPVAELAPEDPVGTGVVKLNTLNPHQLTVDTYIAKSKYHQIVNQAAGVNRDSLFNNMLAAEAILNNPAYVNNSKMGELSQTLNEADLLFFNSDTSQEELDDIEVELSQLISQITLPNLTNLQEMLSQVKSLDLSNYSELTANNLESEVITVEAAMETQSLTEDTVQSMINQLEMALNQLELSPELYYTSADFIYDGSIVLGLSDTGLKKAQHNKDLVIPDANLDGRLIDTIAPRAFETTEGVVYGSDAIQSPNGFKSVTLPVGLQHIGDGAFRTNQLTEVYFPESLETIGSTAFNGNQLVNLSLPNSITEIGSGAFSLNMLRTVKLPEGIKEIGPGVFARNIYLEHIDIPNSVEVVGQSAFIGAPLQALEIPSSVERIDRLAFSSHRLESLTIPGNVKYIADNSFAHNLKFRTLRELVLEEGIEHIGDNAFKASVLSEVYLPNSLETLGELAFSGNTDPNNNPFVVKLYTKNPAHLAFNTEKSLQHQEVILLEVETTTDRVEYQEEVAYEVVRKANPDLPKGQERRIQDGQNGQISIVEEITYEDGVEISRQEISRQIITQVVNEVVEFGILEIDSGQPKDDNDSPTSSDDVDEQNLGEDIKNPLPTKPLHLKNGQSGLGHSEGSNGLSSPMSQGVDRSQSVSSPSRTEKDTLPQTGLESSLLLGLGLSFVAGGYTVGRKRR